MAYGDFDDWDRNDHHEVTKSEYMEAVPDPYLIKDWDIDQDETISKEVFAQAVNKY